MLSLLLVLLGGLSLAGLQVENLPPIAPTRVTVRSTYPGGGPEVVEQGVTALLEKQLNGLERLESIRSTSSASSNRPFSIVLQAGVGAKSLKCIDLHRRLLPSMEATLAAAQAALQSGGADRTA